MTAHGLEQERRDFMQANPSLYEYIRLVEQRKAFKTAADYARGASDQYGAANRCYTLSAHCEERRMRMLEASRGGSPD